MPGNYDYNINLKSNAGEILTDVKEIQNTLDAIERKKYDIGGSVNGNKVDETTQNMNRLSSAATNTNTVFSKMKNMISNTFSTGKLAMTGYLAVLNEIRKASKNAQQAIEDVDKAVTDLSIASGMTREATAGLVKDYNKFAQDLKSTTVEVTSAADDWLRAGKNMNEAKDLIQDSVMLSKLGQISSSEATEDLLATMNGYNMSAEELRKALDAMVAIDFQAATSSGDLATGLKYSASSASSAEVSFNKLVAILGTVQDRTQQSAEVVGTFANTMLSRYRDVTIGKYLSDDGDDISNYESVLKSVGVQLRDAQGEFRDFETVLQEMADKWNGLTSVQQNALIKVAAGTRQQNRFIALMENYNKVLELTEVAANSAGTALDKFNNSYADSLEAKKNTLQASFESMVVNSDIDEVYSGIIEATTALVEFINKTNALKGVVTGLTVSSVLKFFLAAKTGANEAYISLNQFANALKIAKQTNIPAADFDKLLLLSKGLSDSQLKLLLSSKQLSVSQKELILTNTGLSSEEAALKMQSWGLTTAQTGLTAATTTLGNAFKGLFATMIANPIMLITMAISGAVMAYQSYNQKLEESRQKNIESGDAAKENADSLRQLYLQYEKLNSITNKSSSQEEQFKQVVLDITKALGDKASVLEGLTAGTDEYTKALKNATKAELESNYANAKIGAKAAADELQSASVSKWSGSKITIQQNEQMTGVEEHIAALEKVKDILSEYEDLGTYGLEWEPVNWDANKNDMNAVVEYYQALIQARDRLVTDDNADFLMNSDIYKDINNIINTLSDSVEKYTEQQYQALKLNYEWQDGIPTSEEEFHKMESSILSASGAGKQFQDILKGYMNEDFASFANATDAIDSLTTELTTENDSAASATTSLKTFRGAWEALEGVDDDNLKNANKNLMELAESGRLTAQMLEGLDAGQYLMEQTGLSAEKLTEDINDLTDASTQLNTLSGQISKMSDMLADKKNGTTASASDLAGFDVEVRGLDSWQQFEKVMGSTSSTMEECQKAANNLATEWVNSGNYLENLTEDNKNYYVTQLQAMGVENAEEIVTASLAQKKRELALEQEYVNLVKTNGINVTTDLANVTGIEIQQLLDEGKISLNTASKLAELVVKKRLANSNTISTAADIKNLADLAGASTKLGKLLNNLARIKQGFTNGMPSDVAEKQAESLQKQIEELVGGGNSVNIDTAVKIKDTGSSTYKAPTPSKNKTSKKEKTATEFNLIDIYIGNITRAIDKLDAKVSNTWLSWSKRNKALAKELKKVKSLEDAQNKAADFYKKKASKVKLDDKTKKQLRNGAIDITTVKNEKLANKMQKYQDYWESYKQYTDDAADSAQKYFDKLEERFELIQNKYDNKVSLKESKKSNVKNKLDIAESKGQLIGAAYYTKQKQLNNQMMKQRKQEEKGLKEQIKGVKKYSEAWYEMKNKIADVHNEYMQLKQDNVDLQNSINNLKWDRFDELINKIDDVLSETDFLKDMLSDNLFDDNGKFTADGMTSIGLTAQNYDAYMAEAQQYKDMLAEVEKMHKKGSIGYEEYISKMREYSKGQREALQSANSYKKATVDLIRDGLNAQNEAFEKQIELKKKLLDEEKSLKEWQEKIADQNKSISRVQRRLDILSQDDSPENQKTIRELKDKLETLKKEQSDDFYDKSIDDQKESLDTMLENAKTQAENYLKNSEKVFSDATAYINANSQVVASNIEKISKDLGYDISEYITNAWKSGGNAIVGYSNTLTDNIGGIVGQIGIIKSAWDEVCASADRAAQAIVNASNGTTVKQLNNAQNKTQSSSMIVTAKGGKISTVTSGVLSGMSAALGTIKKKVKKSSYATGGIATDLVKLSGEDGMTFLQKGESVLTPEQTKALINFRPVIPQLNTMVDMMKDLPMNTNVPQSPVYQIDNRTIVEGVATNEIVKDMANVAKQQAENVIKNINKATYAKGVRKR